MYRYCITVMCALVVNSTLMVVASSADDLVTKASQNSALIYSWSGVYVGIDGGYGWNQTTGDKTCLTATGIPFGVGCSFPTPDFVTPSGGLFGGQVGRNWQSGLVVYGVETDLQWSAIKGSGTIVNPCCLPDPAIEFGDFIAASNLDLFGTVRARLGVAAANRLLIFVTGGGIYGRESVSNLAIFPTTGISYPASAEGLRTGWTVGGRP